MQSAALSTLSRHEFKIKRKSDWVKFPRRCKFGRRKMVKGWNKRFKRGAEDDGFNTYSGVVKNMGVGQGK